MTASADRPLRILLVEDDPDIRTVAALALERIGGFEVETCDDGRTALERAEVLAPDLVLLDLMMPGLDGTEVLRRLREHRGLGTTPVVMLTASSSSAEIDRLRALGATDVIVKPFDPLTLADAVRSAWRSGR